MRTIWKFPLIIGTTGVEVPEGSEVLMVAVQGGQPHVWIGVDTARPPSRLCFVTVGTGHDIPDGVERHAGSYMLEGGAFVGHVFVLAER